ncbi:hypothetical protein EST38_g1588 [Candolleomyces aberdarensis]|uniref:Uncharacterized protein n=1 Tax=Candolleomyces aberdarensis TaxID=2316362 RepID=A0A4Q2DVH4_9AGAR|nr:hypothetical protein EST38_g1588 [Candolleomyces aberdarensis]
MPRDQNLDSNGSTHQSLGQALGGHLAPPPPQYARSGPDAYRHPSTSPPTLNQPHAGPSGHQGITFAVPSDQTSPALKRKQMDQQMNANGQLMKRRKDVDDDGFDDSGGQGAKHWTDEEKTKLFRWLMGPNSDDHWNALRATKNSCLRDVLPFLHQEFSVPSNTRLQIYAMEAHHGYIGPLNPSQSSEADRLREYERRLGNARKANCDIGNITSRTVEHWFNRGWYELFFRRWHGDPATTRPVQTRSSGGGTSAPQGGDDHDDDDQIDFANSDPTMLVNGINGMSHDRTAHQVNFINPQNLGRDVNQMPPTPQTATGGAVPTMNPPSMQHTPSGGVASANQHHPHGGASAAGLGVGSTPGEAPPPLIPVPFPPQAVSAFMQYMQSQTQMNKMKMEYMRRREEREDKEHRTRLEASKVQLEKEKQELEEKRNGVLMKQKSEKAVELLGRPEIDQTVKAAAAEYLRKIFDE